VMVPSALTRIGTAGSGPLFGPWTGLPLLAGSKIALCAGQMN